MKPILTIGLAGLLLAQTGVLIVQQRTIGQWRQLAAQTAAQRDGFVQSAQTFQDLAHRWKETSDRFERLMRTYKDLTTQCQGQVERALLDLHAGNLTIPHNIIRHVEPPPDWNPAHHPKTPGLPRVPSQ